MENTEEILNQDDVLSSVHQYELERWRESFYQCQRTYRRSA